MRKTLLPISLLLFLLLSSANAQSARWKMMKSQKLVSFDVDCARRESFPGQALGKIVRQAISPERRGDPTAFDDSAFTIKLKEKGPTVYFVPTICGASGNCTWLLYTINPVKSLGRIIGRDIYTYQSSRGMPMIITYGHVSASEGGLSTYTANKGRYRQVGDEYDIGGRNGHRMPAFLETAKRQCEE